MSNDPQETTTDPVPDPQSALEAANNWAQFISENSNHVMANTFMAWVKQLCTEVEEMTRESHIKAEEWAKFQLIASMASNFRLLTIDLEGTTNPTQEMAAKAAHQLYKATKEELDNA